MAQDVPEETGGPDSGIEPLAAGASGHGGGGEGVVPEVGLEPTRLAAMDFESIVYTDFTTRAAGWSVPAWA